MGHIDYYYFIDFRDGDMGVQWTKSTREEIEKVAADKGYVGAIQHSVEAFPPKPLKIDTPPIEIDEACPPW